MYVDNVEIFVPSLRGLSIEELALIENDEMELHKFEVPIYDDYENKLYTIECKKHVYFMTDNIQELAKGLSRYNLPLPSMEDFRPNPALCHSVRLKMTELRARFSVCESNGSIIINYYSKKGGAFFAIAEY